MPKRGLSYRPVGTRQTHSGKRVTIWASAGPQYMDPDDEPNPSAGREEQEEKKSRRGHRKTR